MTSPEPGKSADPAGAARLSPDQIDALRPRLVQFRLVFFALIAGVVVFAAVVLMISGPLVLELPPSLLSLILIGLGVLTGLQGLVLPLLMRSASSKNPSGQTGETVDRLAGVWFSSSLIGVALLESAAFLNLVGLFMERNPVHLVVAGLFVALMFVHYPATNRILDWMEQKLDSRPGR